MQDVVGGRRPTFHIFKFYWVYMIYILMTLKFDLKNYKLNFVFPVKAEMLLFTSLTKRGGKEGIRRGYLGLKSGIQEDLPQHKVDPGNI